METKQFIRSLKGLRTKFTNRPDSEKEKTQVISLSEKVGGYQKAITLLNEAGEKDLKTYLCSVTGVAENKPVRPVEIGDKNKSYSIINGKVYEVDSVKKTLKRVYRDFSELAKAEIATTEMPLTTYQKYLRDRFGEDVPAKNGKIIFRGYRIFCDIENGFTVEDTLNHYQIVDTPFEGIPTPRELGDWFQKMANKPRRENAEVIELKKEVDSEVVVVDDEPEKTDYEKARRKVLRTIRNIESKTFRFDPENFPDMIPHRRWQRKVRSLLTSWKNREMRYAKFIASVKQLTEEETFESSLRPKRNPFKGTVLDDFKTVGELDGNQIQVDGKFIPAVPFMLNYLMHFEPRIMPQIMKYAKGDIDKMQLLLDPYAKDWREEYQPRLLENTVENVMVLNCLFRLVGVYAPHERLYEADLKVGDKIFLLAEDGTFVIRTISSTDMGIKMGRGIGLSKNDCWFKKN